MEFAVYDGPHRRASLMIVVALIVGMLAGLATFLLIPHRGGNGSPASYVFLFPLTLILALVLWISIMTSVRIRIAKVTGEVFRLFTLFGHELRRQRFTLSAFDRVSLNRGFRAGYQVFLLGREQDVLVFLTPNLGTARARAEEIAAECGLKVRDQL